MIIANNTIFGHQVIDMSKLGFILKEFIPKFSTIVPLGGWDESNLDYFCSAKLLVSWLPNIYTCFRSWEEAVLSEQSFNPLVPRVQK